jgi:hypothetical protein
MSGIISLPLPNLGNVIDEDEICFGPELIPGIVNNCENKAEIENRCLKCYKIYSNELIKEKKKSTKEAEKKAKEALKQAEKEAKEAEKKAEQDAIKEKLRIIKEKAQEQYLKHKEEFEEDYLMVCGVFYKIMSDGSSNKITNPQMANITANRIIKNEDEKGNEKKEKFLPIWLADEKRIDYDSIKMYPPGYNGEIAEDKFYNLWNGFKIERELIKQVNFRYNIITNSKKEEWQKLNNEGKITQKDIEVMCENLMSNIRKSFDYDVKKIEKLIEPILNHIDFITGNQKGFTLKWLARIIQFPGIKTEVALLIRDMGSLFVDSGGIGKNLLIEFFGKMILGPRYYHVVSENRELYEDFNTSFNGKLLIFIEEAGCKENNEHKNDMKSKITKKDISVQGKGDNRFTTADFCNYVFTTNNEKPLPIDKRRFAVFDSLTDKRGDVDYFKDLVSKLESFEVQWAFYLYLKNLNTWDSVIEIQTSIPNTKARNELIRHSVPVFMKWMADYSTLVFLKYKHTATETYNHFCNWYRISREGTEANIMKSRDFFNKLKNEDKCFIKSKSSSIYYEGDLEYIITNLKKQFLLSQDYKIEHAEEEWTAYLQSIKLS